MSCPDAQSMAQKLTQLLNHGTLPRSAAKLVSGLSERLQAPVQLTILGPEGAGKTAVINALLRENLIADLNAPVLTLAHGAQAAGQFETETEITPFDGLAGDQMLPEATLRIEQRLPARQLHDLRLVAAHLPKGGPPADRLIRDSLATSDITLWCSAAFDAREAAQWQQLPRRSTENGFLVLTHAEGSTPKAAADHAETFSRTFRLCPAQVAAALATTDRPDTAHWTASGAEALVDALTNRILAGRAADMDLAAMMLAKYGPPKRRAAAENTPAPEPAPLAPMKHPEAMTSALSILQTCVDNIGVDPDAPQKVLAGAQQGVDALAAMMMDACAEDARLDSLRALVTQTEAMLAELDSGDAHAAACDAATALLQIRKEISEVALA